MRATKHLHIVPGLPLSARQALADLDETTAVHGLTQGTALDLSGLLALYP